MFNIMLKENIILLWKISFSYQYTFFTFYVKSVFINPIISNAFLVTIFFTNRKMDYAYLYITMILRKHFLIKISFT